MREIVLDILTGLGIPPESVTDDARLRTDLELDSTEIVEVELEIKRRIGVDVTVTRPADQSVAELCQAVIAAAAAQVS